MCAKKEPGEDEGGGEDVLSSEYILSGRVWRQLRSLVFTYCRALRFAEGLLASRASLTSLAHLSLHGLTARAVADLGKCLTREQLPVLTELTVSPDDTDAFVALDWPFSDDDDDDAVTAAPSATGTAAASLGALCRRRSKSSMCAAQTTGALSARRPRPRGARARRRP
jgi:hypothetical protein